MPFSIRTATVNDIEQILFIRGIVKENKLSNPKLVTKEDCETYLTERGKGWVAFSADTILGFAIVDLKEHNIWALFVHPEHEKKGVGKKLHNTMLNWYFDTGEKMVWLSTDPGTRAEKFYAKQGWIKTGKTANGEARFEMTSQQWKNKPSRFL